MEALPPAGRLWYTKLAPTLHGGGSFCSPYERSDPIDMCISPRSPLGHSKPPHFCTETLALISKSFKARPRHRQDAKPLLLETLVSHRALGWRCQPFPPSLSSAQFSAAERQVHSVHEVLSPHLASTRASQWQAFVRRPWSTVLSNHVCGKLDPPSFNGTWFHKIFGKLNPDLAFEAVKL